MADATTIKTKFFEDAYIQELPPTDKLLYLYLILGPQSQPTLGIYELSLHTMAHHTGLLRENIQHSLNRFAENGKIHYVDGWVIVKNHFKNNPISPNQHMLINRAHKLLMDVPWSVKERVTNPTDSLYIAYLDPTHELYIGNAEPIDTTRARPMPYPSQKGRAKAHPKDGGPSRLKGAPPVRPVSAELAGYIEQYGEADGRAVWAAKHGQTEGGGQQ